MAIYKLQSTYRAACVTALLAALVPTSSAHAEADPTTFTVQPPSSPKKPQWVAKNDVYTVAFGAEPAGMPVGGDRPGFVYVAKVGSNADSFMVRRVAQGVGLTIEDQARKLLAELTLSSSPPVESKIKIGGLPTLMVGAQVPGESGLQDLIGYAAWEPARSTVLLVLVARSANAKHDAGKAFIKGITLAKGNVALTPPPTYFPLDSRYASVVTDGNNVTKGDYVAITWPQAPTVTAAVPGVDQQTKFDIAGAATYRASLRYVALGQMFDLAKWQQSVRDSSKATWTVDKELSVAPTSARLLEGTLGSESVRALVAFNGNRNVAVEVVATFATANAAAKAEVDRVFGSLTVDGVAVVPPQVVPPPVVAPPVVVPPVVTPPVATNPPPVATTSTPPANVAPAKPPAKPAKPFESSQYTRSRGLGVFHRAHVTIGAAAGEGFAEGGTMSESRTAFTTAIEGVYLGVPSLYGNFHGIEAGFAIRTGPGEANLSLGFPVTLLNIGRGQPGSIRIGASLGGTWGNIHSFFYAKPRVALVVVPDRIDIEASASLTPTVVSTGPYERKAYRVTAWLRRGGPKSNKFYELYAESFSRVTVEEDAVVGAPIDKSKDFTGMTFGLGLTL